MRSGKTERQLRVGLRVHVICYAAAHVAQVVVWWLFTPQHFFWPLYSLAAWGIGLAFHARAVSSSSRQGFTVSFLLEFVRDPLTVGAVAPSGTALASVATTVVPRSGAPIVVELGPGTGSFTTAIQRRLTGRGRHIAVEVNARFAERLAVLHPEVDVVHADATDLATVLAQRALRQADVVVSGLPWAAFSESRQREVLSSVVAALAPDGVFTTFAYVHARWTPPARRLLRSVRSRFDEVVVSRTVWANLPPALVYYCRRPADAGAHDAVRRKPRQGAF